MDPNTQLNELKALYDQCTPEMRNVFADVVAEASSGKSTEEIVLGLKTAQNTPLPKEETPWELHSSSVKAKPKTFPKTKKRVYGILADIEIEREKIVTSTGRKVALYDSLWSGLDSYGYRITMASQYIPVSSSKKKVVDPITTSDFEIEIAEKSADFNNHDVIAFEPGETIICMSEEIFTLPEDVIGHLYNLNEYSKIGIIGSFSPVLPNFTGRLTMTLTNTNRIKGAVMYPQCACAYIQFERPYSMCKALYRRRRDGK